MRPIDADALRARMYHDAFEVDSDFQKWESGCWIRYKMFENAIEDAPTIDAVEVKHGEWIIKENHGTGWYRITCSECGEDVTSTAPCIGFMPIVKVLWNYCPECGAKMDGERKNND